MHIILIVYIYDVCVYVCTSMFVRRYKFSLLVENEIKRIFLNLVLGNICKFFYRGFLMGKHYHIIWNVYFQDQYVS